MSTSSFLTRNDLINVIDAIFPATSEDMTDAQIEAFINSVEYNLQNQVDYIVEQGTSGIWTYRKWNSGIAECWGNTSGAISSGWSQDGITINLPFTLLTVQLAQVQFRNYQVARAYTTITGTNASSVNIQTQADSAVTGSFSINIKGTWK